MKVNRFFLAIAFLVCLGLSSCSNEATYKDYVAHINNPDNGLVKTKTIGGVKVSLRMVPSQFWAYKDIKGDKSQRQLDSLDKLYNESYNFILSLGNTEENKDKDIMYKELGGVEEFRERADMMNFNLGDYCWINTSSGEVHPVLSNMENTYGISKERKIHFVFGKKSEEVDLTSLDGLKVSFDDPLFGTGKTNFVFSKSDINNIPKLVIEE